jgi:hypothetical protein
MKCFEYNSKDKKFYNFGPRLWTRIMISFATMNTGDHKANPIDTYRLQTTRKIL